MLTNGNSMINGGLLQISDILLVNPLRPGNHWVPGEDHTGVEVHMKGCEIDDQTESDKPLGSILLSSLALLVMPFP